MSRSTLFRFVLSAILAVAVLAPTAFSQSQDSQSVAEAARKAREKKKNAAKPTKVITDENLDVKKGDVQSAVAEEPKMPGAPDTKGQAANPPANAATGDSSKEQNGKNEKLKKEIAALKDQLKEALTDLDILQRESRLDQEAFYSKPDFASDTAGKQKLDDQKQQISDKQQQIERLKAKLADLQKSLGDSSSASSQP